MATDHTFSVNGLNAAQLASTTDLQANPRSSFYVTDKGPSRFDRGKAKIKHFCKALVSPVMNLLSKGKDDKTKPTHVFGHSVNRNTATWNSLTGENLPVEPQRPTTSGTTTANVFDAPQSDRYRTTKTVLSAVQVPDTPPVVAQSMKKNEKRVTVVHPATTDVFVPTAPSTPASGSTFSTNSAVPQPRAERFLNDTDSTGNRISLTENVAKASYLKSRGVVPGDNFPNRLDGHKNPADIKPTKIVSAYFSTPPSVFLTDTSKAGRINSEPPAIPLHSPFDPHISGFSNPRTTYKPGMFYASPPKLRQTSNASTDEVNENRNAALEALEGTGEGTVTADEASPVDDTPKNSSPKGKKPVYDSRYCPNAQGGRLYFPVNGGVGEGKPFDVYGGTPYASSDALVGDNGSSDTFKDSRPSTATSAPDFPSISDKQRHSKFYQQTENCGTFTSQLPACPANPEPPASPDEATFLESVYKNPPQMAAPAPQQLPRDTLKVPVPARKPVPKSAASSSKPKAKPDVNKSLPPSPAPGSPRCFTPTPGSQFPPRTDSLANRTANGKGLYLHPNAQVQSKGNVPERYSMNDNGYKMLDVRASREWKASPAYQPRGPMNPMEAEDRVHALRRQESKREAEAKAKAKAEKRAEKKMLREEKAARKMCGLP